MTRFFAMVYLFQEALHGKEEVADFLRGTS